jgi:BRCA1-associated protein
MESKSEASGWIAAEGPQSFYFGNPNVKSIRGVIEFASTSTSPVLCIVDIPTHVSVPELAAFVAPEAADITHLQVIQPRFDSGGVLSPVLARSASEESQVSSFDLVSPEHHVMTSVYCVLIRFKSRKPASKFCERYSLKQFNSIERDVCKIRRVKSIKFQKGSSWTFPKDDSEIRKEGSHCAICLDKFAPLEDAVIWVLCCHVFHLKCLIRWKDYSCPVCRFVFTPPSFSTCSECGTHQDLWVCLICGNIGCGRYSSGHAASHFASSGHAYSLDLETRNVWDYVGDNYVHRIVQTKSDEGIKLTPTPHPEHVSVPTLLHHSSLKLEQLHTEFNYLLTSQMQMQREMFRKRIAELESSIQKEHARLESSCEQTSKDYCRLKENFAQLSEEVKLDGQKASTLQEELDQLKKKRVALQELHDKLKSRNQAKEAKLETENSAEEARLRKMLEEKQNLVALLREQLQDLQTHLKTCQAFAKSPSRKGIDTEKSYIFVGDASPSSSPGGKGSRRSGTRSKK